MKFLFLLFPLCLLATVNEPFRCELFSGYRNDRIHFHLQEPGEGGAATFSEIIKDIQYWENGLILKTIHRDLTFFLRGAYGTFGEGNGVQNFPMLPGQPQVHFSTSGWTASALGYFGYAVNLTADRVYKVVLIPLIGYSAEFEQLKAHQSFHLVWNGVFLGAGFLIQPVERLGFSGGYSYHFMHNQVHAQVEVESIKTSSGGNKGHTGWLQMDYSLNRLWRAGIGGQIHYFMSRVVGASVQPSNQESESEKFKLRWTALSGWAQLSRSF